MTKLEICIICYKQHVKWKKPSFICCKSYEDNINENFIPPTQLHARFINFLLLL